MDGVLTRNKDVTTRLAGSARISAVKDNLWLTFLQRLAEQLGAVSTARVMHDFAHGQSRLCEAINVEPGFTVRFDSIAPLLHAVLRRPENAFTSGVVIRDGSSEAYVDQMAAERFRREWADPQGLGDMLCGLVTGEGEQCILLIFGRRRGQPRFSDHDAAILLGALGGAHLVWRTERQLRATRYQSVAAWGTLDALAVGVVLLDGTGRVQNANQAGREIIDRRTCLTITNNFLSCVHARDAGRLRQAIDALVAVDPGSDRTETVALSVHRTDESPMLPMVLCRVDRRTGEQQPEQILLAAFLCDQDRIDGPNEAWLREWYGLSRVDAEIAVSLARGCAPDEIAARMHASIHTVRAHLKRIFWKAGVARQSKLIRLLLAGPALIRGNRMSNAVAPPPDR